MQFNIIMSNLKNFAKIVWQTFVVFSYKNKTFPLNQASWEINSAAGGNGETCFGKISQQIMSFVLVWR